MCVISIVILLTLWMKRCFPYIMFLAKKALEN